VATKQHSCIRGNKKIIRESVATKNPWQLKQHQLQTNKQ